MRTKLTITIPHPQEQADDDLIMLDVRNRFEYAIGHFETIQKNVKQWIQI